ncbi:MAG: CheR family methyltransferase, partial [Steroidobacteraceae bacterium]
MPADLAADPPWSRLSELIAQKTGLHFPPERSVDLQRALSGAAGEFGFSDPLACADWLVSTRLTSAQMQVLAGHLTVGETYFFRERPTFEALAEHVIPELAQRRWHERRLRVWSAACCTGEEAYSLAILLQQRLPAWRQWRITLLATDINERFLDKARNAVYGEWSFRDAPAGLKERYFTRTAEDRFMVNTEIQQLVRFARFNLVEDDFSQLLSTVGALDLILCRNVLMYFTPAQARKVVTNLRRVLCDDGWLAVAATEGSHALLHGFMPANFPGTILYQKNEAAPKRAPPPQAQAKISIQPVAAPVLPPLTDSKAAPEPEELASRARSLANQGSLHEALTWCDRWIGAAPLDSAARYLRAVVLQELGDRQGARLALNQAIYLNPELVLAHFALGNLDKTGGKETEARKHFTNALTLVRRASPTDLLPESDGLTAQRLEEIIVTLLQTGTAS